MNSHEEKKKMKRTVNVPTSNLEIPVELAYLMDRCSDIPPMHTERNWISAVGRVPTFPSIKNDLPPDINNYVLPRFFRDHGIGFQLGFRTSPLNDPIIPKSNSDLVKKSVEAFRLILRFTFDDTLSQTQEHILGSYIVHMAMQNLEIREEIYVQVMNQCVNYDDEVGLKRLWLLMANLLSACKPGDRIENYVIKFVSDHGINGWNTLCQMKILSARPQCRLFPPCSLEWKSNKKSACVALPVQFLDGQTITLDVDSFTIAEDLARHGLSIRADSIHGLKGWSLALQFDNEITEMGGHGYVLDPLSCVELRNEWNKIGGSTGSMFFLISRDKNRSPRTNMMSSELDSWLEDVFDQALTSDRSMDPKQVQGWIHGLGDPVIPTMPFVQGGMSVPIVGAAGVAPTMTLATPMVGIADPIAQAQTAQLQTAIQQAQLQNTLLQHNVQREMLVSQLNQLQAVNSQQLQLQTIPTQGQVLQRPVVQQQPLLVQQQPQVVQQQPPVLQRQTQLIRQQSHHKSQPPPPPINQQQHIGGPPVMRSHNQDVRQTANLGGSMNSSSGDPMSPEPDRRSPRERLSQTTDSEVLKNRARTIRVGRVSWPPPVQQSDVPEKPEPKRLPIERDPDAPRRNFSESKAKPSIVSTSAAPTSPKPTVQRTKSSTSVAPAAITVNIVTPKSTPEKSTASIMVNSPKDVTLKQDKQLPERKFTAASAPSHILTEEDFQTDRSPSQKRIEEVPHVDVAGRARQLANQLFLGTSEVETVSKDTAQSSDKWFSGHYTKLLDAGPDRRHYMYTMVPWKLIIRKEIFSPDERMESPMLLDILFSQIVFDVVKQPCIRLSIDEKKKLVALMANHNVSANLDDLKKQSNQVKKLFVDAAKNSPFYFGRFYAAEWHNPNSNFYPVNWVMVNHVGVHLVHHQENDELKALKTILFEEIQSVTKVDSRLLSLTTRVNDRYDLICHMVGSLKSLIEQYLEESERVLKGLGAVRRSDSNLSQLRSRSEGFMQRNSEAIAENGVESIGITRMSADTDMEDIVRYGVSHFKENSRPKVEAILRWGKAPLQHSLHNFEDPGDEKLAVEAFLAILTFMHDYPMERETSIVDYALVLLEIPMRRRDLVDEIYCQLIKQTRPVDAENPSRENLASCWCLFSLFAMFFDCSDKLRPYLIRYIQNAKANEELEGVAATTLKNLEQTQKYGGRKLLPLRSELDAEINGYSAKRIQLTMSRGLKAAVQLTPISVIDEIIEELCSSLGVTDDLERTEYTIFTVLSKENISSPLRGEQYAFDVITDLTMTGRPFHFYFCRTSWIADLQLRSRSPELIDLWFKQVMDDHVAGSWMLNPIGEGTIHQARDIARLAAIQQKVNNALATTISNKELKQLLPASLSNYQPLRDHEWLARAKAQLRQLVRYTSTECKADALEILNGWYLFGAMCFAVRTGLRSIIPDQNVLMCLCRAGLVLLDVNNHKFHMNIPFNEVFSYEVTIDSSGPTQLDLKVSNDRTIRCYSNQANKIVHILNQYMKLTNGV